MFVKFLCKGNLNSDGQQFPQYQQNKLSPLTTNHIIGNSHSSPLGQLVEKSSQSCGCF
jgi:hypothetical protein